MKKQNCWEVWLPSNGHPTRRIRGGFYWMPGDIRTFPKLGDIPDDIYAGDDKSFVGDHQNDRDFVIRSASFSVPRSDKRLVTHPVKDADAADKMVYRMQRMAVQLAAAGWKPPKDVPADHELAVDVIALYGEGDPMPEAEPVADETPETTTVKDETPKAGGKGGKPKGEKG